MKITRVYLLLLFVFVLAVPDKANAGFKDELENLFDGMLVATSPGSAETQRRGVFHGGGFYYRSKVLSPKLIAFDPPRIDGLQGDGCNSINFYGGSISFIKKDEIVQFLRSIASNAAGYIFQLALSSACDKCAQWISMFQEQVRKMNEMLKNSCYYAKQLVATTGLDEVAKSAGETARAGVNLAGSMANTVAGNMYEFFHDAANSAENKDATTNVQDKTLVEQNITWEIIVEQKLYDWMGDNSQETANVLMGIVGPIVMEFADTDANTGAGIENPNDGLQPNEYPTTMNFKELVYGIEGPSQRSDCAFTEACLGDQVGSSALIGYAHTPMVDFVKAMILGGTVNGTTYTGLVIKFQSNVGSLTTQELSFIQNSRIPIAAFVRNLAEKNVIAHSIIDAVVEYIAFDMARQWVLEAINGVQKALKNTNTVAGDSILKRRLEELTDEIKWATEELNQKDSKESNIHEAYEYIMSSTNSEKTPVRSHLDSQLNVN